MIDFYKKYFRSNQAQKNWEQDVTGVRVEACGCDEDPLGYRAVFLLNEGQTNRDGKGSFAIGASLLTQRESNLNKSGYQAPMTHKAIALIEGKIGSEIKEAA